MRKTFVTISLVCTLAILFVCITGCGISAEPTNDRETIETAEKDEALSSETEAESPEIAERTSSEPEQTSSEPEKSSEAPEETSSEAPEETSSEPEQITSENTEEASSEDTGSKKGSSKSGDYGIEIMVDETINPEYLKTIKTYFNNRIENYFGNTVSNIDWIAEEEAKRIENLNAWAVSCDFEFVKAKNQVYIVEVLEETEDEIIFLVDELNTLKYKFSHEEELRTTMYEDWHVMHMSKENYSIISQSYVEEYVGNYLYGDDKEVQFILAHGGIPWEEVRQ